MRAGITTILLIVLGLFAEAQTFEAPSLDCVEVVGNDVNLIWSPPANSSGQFDGYDIFTYDTLGNFSSLIASYNTIGQITHTDMGTLADTEAIQYYVQANYGTGGNLARVSSDTVSTIDLSLFIDNGTAAVLSWNYPFVSNTDSAIGSYDIEMLYNGEWTLIGTTPFGQEAYTYVVDVCHGLAADIPLSYRVRTWTTTFCGILSNVRQGNFSDLNPPSTPIIETVTVDTTNNKAVICWLPSPEEDTGGYIVLNSNEIPVGTVADPADSIFQNPTSLAAIMSEGYLVVAFDTCYHPDPNTSSAADAIPQFSIFPNLDFVKCDQAITIEWNPYINWDLGVSHYEVYGGLFGEQMQLIDSVGPNSTLVVHEGVERNMTYCYVVKAHSVENRKPSLSSKVCIFTDYPQLPDYTYLANVDVISATEVELTAIVDTNAVKSSFAFQKLDRFGEDFETMTTLPQELHTDGILTTTDFNAQALDKIHSYRVMSLDSCNIPFSVSDTSKNIRLDIFPNPTNRTNTLTWQHYETWDGTIKEYHVYRDFNGQFLGFPYAVVDSTQTFFIDEIDSEFDYLNTSTTCYYVQAIESNNSFGLNETSRSNIRCASQEPLIYIPNAIVINGLNPIFQPVAGYFDKSRYRMQIYDRWGRELFSTTDFEQGWDGTDGSGYVQEGVYVYLISFFSGNGEEFIRRGNLSVLIAGKE